MNEIRGVKSESDTGTCTGSRKGNNRRDAPTETRELSSKLGTCLRSPVRIIDISCRVVIDDLIPEKRARRS